MIPFSQIMRDATAAGEAVRAQCKVTRVSASVWYVRSYPAKSALPTHHGAEADCHDWIAEQGNRAVIRYLLKNWHSCPDLVEVIAKEATLGQTFSGILLLQLLSGEEIT